MRLGPQAGPQTLFAKCNADIAIYSGEVGSGKTYALVNDLGRWSHIPGYVGAAFRRDYKQLVGGGSLWDVATKTWPKLDARVRMPEHKAVWTSGASCEFHHLHLESSKTDHDGKEYAVIALDELAHFSDSQFWYMLMRNRSTCGVVPYVRATCMASPDTWLYEFVKPWLLDARYPDHMQSGRIRWMIRDDRDQILWFDSEQDAIDHDPDALPMTVTVIHARTKDNVELMRSDPKYLSKLSLLTTLERAIKRDGDWGARPESAGYFNRTWFKVRDVRPARDQILFSVRGWDKAASKKTKDTGLYSDDPDFTSSVLLDVLRNGEVCISDVTLIQDSPGGVDVHYYKTAELDGPQVVQAFWIDPAQAGLVDEVHTRSVLAPLVKELRCGPIKFVLQSKNIPTLAKPVSGYADPATPGIMSIVRGPNSGQFFAMAEQFPLQKDAQGNKIHDDPISAMARAWLEAKDKLPLERAGNPGAGWLDRMRIAKP